MPVLDVVHAIAGHADCSWGSGDPPAAAAGAARMAGCAGTRRALGIRPDMIPAAPLPLQPVAAPPRRWQQALARRRPRPARTAGPARPGRAGRARLRRRRRAVPAAGAARLRRPHAPRRSARPAAAPGAAAGRRRCAPCPASASTRSATARAQAGDGVIQQIPTAAPCWWPPAAARSIAATASAATSPTPRRPPPRDGWREAVDADPRRPDASTKCILSGGDPLSLADRQAGRAHRRAGRRSRTCAACASTPACRWCCPSASTTACWPGCAACRGR